MNKGHTSVLMPENSLKKTIASPYASNNSCHQERLQDPIYTLLDNQDIQIDVFDWEKNTIIYANGIRSRSDQDKKNYLYSLNNGEKIVLADTDELYNRVEVCYLQDGKHPSLFTSTYIRYANCMADTRDQTNNVLHMR